MKITETACELCRLLKEEEEEERRSTNREFRRFAYKACTGQYSFRM